jgi:DNA-binding MarR family transcriptional regulator
MDALSARKIGEECMGLNIRRAARRMTRIYDEAFSSVDLTIGQFSLLTVLAGQERWAMQPLADVLGTDRSSLTAMLKPLERRALVASEPDALDRRARYLVLTQAGKAVLEQAEPLWRSAQHRIVTLVGTENAADLRATLARLT